MDILSAVLLVVFATFGVIAFARELCFWIFKDKCSNGIVLLTPVKRNCGNAEMLLRCAVAKIKWVSRGKNDCVICLDCDMDENTKEVCQKICKDNPTVKFMEKSELIEMLTRAQNE